MQFHTTDFESSRNRLVELVINVGFLGAGDFANTMADVIRRADNVNLFAVASRDKERAAALNPEHVFVNYQDVLTSPDVDLVYVVLSNDLHFPWVMAALAHGKNVLCEKPLGLDAEEAALMFDAANAAGLLLVEAYWHLWHPRFALAKSLIASGAIGEVISINSGFTHMSDFETNYRSIEARGGGMLLDLACYPISAATYLLDQPVLTRPLILEREPRSGGVEMHIKATADLGTVSLTITASAQREADRWFDVLGTTGSISLTHPAFSSAPEPQDGTVLICTVDEMEQEWLVPASDPRSLMISEVASAVISKRSGVEPHWSFRPDSKLSILTAHAIDVLKKSEAPVP